MNDNEIRCVGVLNISQCNYSTLCTGYYGCNLNKYCVYQRPDIRDEKDKEITELKESTYGYINLIKDLTKENKRLKEDLKLYKGMVV